MVAGPAPLKMTTHTYPLALVAWTGGDTPRTADIADRTAPVFLAMRSALFREQLATWRNANGAGSLDVDTARIFWNRARLDAWRSYTESKGAR
jgi:hypothetical protein